LLFFFFFSEKASESDESYVIDVIRSG